MSTLFIKVCTNFFSHRKTIRLRALLGDDAYWIPPRLWTYAAESQPDGDFSAYSADEIAMVIGYNKDASIMVEALQEAGFLEEDMTIHDWHEHNGFHKTFFERAKAAANARWVKERTKEKGKEKRREDIDIETSIASSNATSMLQACALSPEEQIYEAYPRKKARGAALKAIRNALEKHSFEFLLERTTAFAKSCEGQSLKYIPYPATWFNAEQFNDEDLVSGRAQQIDWDRDIRALASTKQGGQ